MMNISMTVSQEKVEKMKNQLGDRIRGRLKERGMSQTQLADIVGIGQSQISKILNGERGTDVENIKRIASALGESQQLYINLYAGLPMTQKDIYILEIEEDIAHLKNEQDKDRVRQFIRILSGGGDNSQRPKKITRGQRTNL